MKRWLLIATLAIPAACAASAALDLRWNLSPSVERGLYRQAAQPPGRGDLVAVCLPEPVGRWARGRGYLSRGPCPGGSARIGKHISGLEGDLIEITEETIAVNGRRLEGVSRVTRDSKGRPMPLVPEGKLVLGPGQIWLHAGRRTRSFDSRIFGPLDVAQVRGVLEPIWILDED